MATVASSMDLQQQPGRSSGGPAAAAVDRWIFVFTAATFVVVTLTGFIPDSLQMIANVKSGARPPLPPILHAHAVLMGSWLLLLLTQTSLMATRHRALHQKLGRVAMLLAPALVLVGMVLVPTMYRMSWHAAEVAPAGAAGDAARAVVPLRDNIMLLQFRIAILFATFILLGVRARRVDSGLHKRMMILGTAIAMPAAIDRIHWLPSTFPMSPLSSDLYTLLLVAPLFAWDVARHHRVHRAWWIWLGIAAPVSVPVYLLWGTPAWQAIAPHLMGL